MRYFRRSAFLRLIVLPFTLSLSLAACTSYKTLSPPYAESIAREEPKDVMVTLTDGSRFHVRNPRVESDSLLGVVYDAKSRSYTSPLSVAVAEVSAIERQASMGAKGIVALSVLGGIAVALIATCAGEDSNQLGSPC